MDFKKDQLQSQIDQIEDEKDLVSKKYEDMLSEQYLYTEANKLLASQASNEILNLIEQFAPDWSDYAPNIK